MISTHDRGLFASVVNSASSNVWSVGPASSPPTAWCSAPSAVSFLARPGGRSWVVHEYMRQAA